MTADRGTARKWWTLIAMALSGGLIMLDETVVGIALPTLRNDLNMSQTSAHWVISIYMLVFACCAAAGGRLGDIVGFRKLLIIGAALFALGSLACGLASDGVMLIAARAVQGLGAAAIFPMTVAMIMVVFPKDQRGIAIGTLAAISTVFLALGPIVGGYLSEVVSWRWIFWINVPVVVAATAIVVVAFPRQPSRDARERFDTSGFVTLTAGLTLLVFSIMQGPTVGWISGLILGCFAGGVFLLIGFILIEARKNAPLIDVSLFRLKAFSAANLIIFTGQYSKITIVVFGALYFQDKLGMQPIVAGATLLLAVVGFPFLSTAVGRMADNTGARRLVLNGQMVATAAMFLIALTAQSEGLKWMVAGLVLWGLGMPFVYAPVLREMANAVPVQKQGQVGGIGVSFRLLGGAVATAISSSILSVSGNFQLVFFSTAILMLVALLFGFMGLTRDAPQPVADRSLQDQNNDVI
ncbi:Multidrug resistance protein stp [Roseovarius albus]|uniref:Multidrug resistance protein stp n=1 Tax=Roseovarius albus TaxID=1247867 RepID=A0A1X7A0A2_9RHOB|nr:MFS transporter [Roseovarius albus]SLN66893.1 Multidrug resistance protein stp [Roseovarius albus]